MMRYCLLDLNLAKDIAISIMSTSGLLVTILLGFVLVSNQSKRLLVRPTIVLYSCLAFILASAVSCWSLVAILGGADSGAINAWIQVQAFLFSVGLGLMCGGVLRILRPRRN
jgi:apolipoprotein N-acyltransferase